LKRLSSRRERVGKSSWFCRVAGVDGKISSILSAIVAGYEELRSIKKILFALDSLTVCALDTETFARAMKATRTAQPKRFIIKNKKTIKSNGKSFNLFCFSVR
jgi:hypothetical protein